MKIVTFILTIALIFNNCTDETRSRNLAKNDSLQTKDNSVDNLINAENGINIVDLFSNIKSKIISNGYIERLDVDKSRFNYGEYLTHIDNIHLASLENKNIKTSLGKATVNVILYEYDERNKAIDVFKKISNEEFKEWTILIQINNYILKVYSICNMPENEWNIIQNIIESEIISPELQYSCKCGGWCEFKE